MARIVEFPTLALRNRLFPDAGGPPAVVRAAETRANPTGVAKPEAVSLCEEA